MSERVSYAVAAELLGCHVSKVAKLVAKGELHSVHRRGAALDRAEVQDLADRRRQARAFRNGPKRQPVDPRPDAEHVWLRPAEVAAMVGITEQGVTQRLSRGRMPGVRRGRQWWVRVDHLEQIEAAKLAGRIRRL